MRIRYAVSAVSVLLIGLCLGAASPQKKLPPPGGAPAAAGLKLGAVLPTHAFDAGNFRVTVYPGGKTNISPRFGAHFHPLLMRAAPPQRIDWYTKAQASLSRMYRNDVHGDCVIASSWHQIGVHTANESGAPVLATDAEVDAYYVRCCGYLGNDVGCVVTDVLNFHQNTGFATGGGVVHKIDGYASVDWSNETQVRTALALFGYLKCALALPSAWHTNARPGGVWDVPTGAGANIVGGHDVGAVGADDRGVQITTWGIYPPITITWAAFTRKGHDARGNTTWLSECYVPLSPDWYARGNLAPNGVSAATLRTDLQMIKDGQLPDVPPQPEPPAPPAPPGPVVRVGEVYADGMNVWWWNTAKQPVSVKPFPTFVGEVRVASDGRFVACVPGPGGGPHLTVFDFETGKVTVSMNVPGIATNFRGGLNVSMAKGWGQVSVSPSDTGGPVVTEIDPATGRVLGTENRGVDPNSRHGLFRFLIAR